MFYDQLTGRGVTRACVRNRNLGTGASLSWPSLPGRRRFRRCRRKFRRCSRPVRRQRRCLPAPGFVSTYEIVRTLRSAGFDPLAPPLREGTIYVARATDYRGILMRVVLDARTGAIRDANRIVPGPGNFGGPYGGVYGERAYGPYGPGPYGPDPDDEDDAGPYGPGPYGGPGIARLPYGLPPDADAPPAPRRAASGHRRWRHAAAAAAPARDCVAQGRRRCQTVGGKCD